MGLWWEQVESVREAARESDRSALQDPGPRGEYPVERARVRRELAAGRERQIPAPAHSSASEGGA